jgi:uncharacterized protein YndB with AHSA1/START domain
VPTGAANIPISEAITVEMRINAAPTLIFPFLTCPARMRTWLAPVVEFAAHVGGRLVMADLNGLRIEGEVVELVPDSTLTLMWGGIEGLKAGQSIVKFALAAAAEGAIVHLCHCRLPQTACDMHGFGWRRAGLPRLKRVVEGRAPGGTYLGDIADARERAPYLTRFSLTPGAATKACGEGELTMTDVPLVYPEISPIGGRAQQAEGQLRRDGASRST